MECDSDYIQIEDFDIDEIHQNTFITLAEKGKLAKRNRMDTSLVGQLL